MPPGSQSRDPGAGQRVGPIGAAGAIASLSPFGTPLANGSSAANGSSSSLWMLLEKHSGDHVPSRNKLAGPRGLALQQEVRKSAAVAVRAMSVVQIVTRRRAVGSPVCHRHPARRAQLPPLCHHAFRGLRHVRSELRTKPHRIRRASLARLWAALSGSVCDPHCAHSNQ